MRSLCSADATARIALVELDKDLHKAIKRIKGLNVRGGTARLLTELSRGLPLVQLDATRKRMADLTRTAIDPKTPAISDR